MAHFAQIDQNSLVTQIIVVSNDEIKNLSFPESERLGVAFCQSLFGKNTVWKQTSYTPSFRKNFAGIGFQYHEKLDAFIPPKPFASWFLNENTGDWEAPVPYPADGSAYNWDEDSISWGLRPKKR